MPTPSPTTHHALVQAALADFNLHERYLLEANLSERCICARFAMYLEKQLQAYQAEGYTVDVEYNRGMDGHDRSPKRLNDDLIVVDLIIHKRGYDNEMGYQNLICMEMKKSTNRIGCGADEARLGKMTDPDYGFNYKTGFMIVADMKQCALTIKSIFRNGVHIPAVSTECAK